MKIKTYMYKFKTIDVKMFRFKLSSTNCFIKTLSLTLPFLLLIEISTIHIQAQSEKLQDLVQFDPIVWDTSSLYHKPHYKNNLFRNKRSLHQSTSATNQLVDACQSKMEVITPYYATNSKGKVRTVVNSELMQQAIQIETCVRTPQTTSNHHNQNDNYAGKCNAQIDCGCEQKYKWHRLLVLDLKESEGSKGLFMDWFLFPSSCVCRCKSSPQKFLLKQQQQLKRS